MGITLVLMLFSISFSVNGARSQNYLHPAKVYEPLTRVFDRREKPYGWLGSDGGSSARLSDGRDAFAFSDSLIGTADKEGNIGSWSMVRNCLIITNTEGGDPDYFKEVIGVPNQLSLDDAAFIKGTGNWQADNAVLSLTDEQAAFGDYSMKATVTSDGVSILRNGKGRQGINISKGEPVTVKAMIKSRKEQRVKIGIEFYNGSNELISRHESEDITVTVSDWTRLSFTAEAPKNKKAFAFIYISLEDCLAGDVFYIANCGLYKGDASMQSWSLPGKGWKYENLVNPEEVNLVDEDDLHSSWFWFSGAVSIGSKLYVFMNHYGHNDGVPPWNFEFKNNQYLGQWDTETNTFEGIFEWSKDDPVQWGTCHLKEDGYIFFIGYNDRDHYLVRVPEDNIFGQKEFWNGTHWTTNRDEAETIAELKFFGGNMDGICKINDKYLAVYIESFGKEIKLLTADSITGPWEDTNKVIYSMTELGEGSFAYIPRIHNQFTTEKGIVMSYSSNNGEGKLSTYKFVISSPVDSTDTPPESGTPDVKTPVDSKETPVDTKETPVGSKETPDETEETPVETPDVSEYPEVPETGPRDIGYFFLAILLLSAAIIVFKYKTKNS